MSVSELSVTVTVVVMMVARATKTDIRVDQSILKSNAGLGAAILVVVFISKIIGVYIHT